MHFNSTEIRKDHVKRPLTGESFPELIEIEVTLTLMFTLSHMHTLLQLNTQPIKAKRIGKIFGL